MKWYCSADSHVAEPEDVYIKRVPRAMKDRAPHYEHRSDGTLMTVVDGHDTVALPPEMFNLPDGSLLPSDDVPARLALLDKDNVWAEAIIGNLAGTVVFGIEEPDFAMACAQAYNDWLIETYVPFGERQVGIAFIPICVDPDTAIKEIARVHEAGIKGFTLPLWPPEPYYLERYDPIWEAANALQMPVSFHAHTGTYFKRIFIENRHENLVARSAAANLRHRNALKTAGGLGGPPEQGYQAYQVAGQMIGAGLLEKYPDLHLCFIECGAGWLLSAIQAVDYVWQALPGESRVTSGAHSFTILGSEWTLPLRPSEYFHRQVHATFQDEEAAILFRDAIGISQLMWGSDFPHIEGTWPRSQEVVEHLFMGVGDADREAILGGTFAKLYGLKVPA